VHGQPVPWRRCPRRTPSPAARDVHSPLESRAQSHRADPRPAPRPASQAMDTQREPSLSALSPSQDSKQGHWRDSRLPLARPQARVLQTGKPRHGAAGAAARGKERGRARDARTLRTNEASARLGALGTGGSRGGRGRGTLGGSRSWRVRPPWLEGPSRGDRGLQTVGGRSIANFTISDWAGDAPLPTSPCHLRPRVPIAPGGPGHSAN
jgi:hypothetical protein